MNGLHYKTIIFLVFYLANQILCFEHLAGQVLGIIIFFNVHIKCTTNCQKDTKKDCNLLSGSYLYIFAVESCTEGCTFDKAQQVCKSRGGKLAEPESADLVKNFVNIPNSKDWNWWTGATTLSTIIYNEELYYWESDRKTIAKA